MDRSQAVGRREDHGRRGIGVAAEDGGERRQDELGAPPFRELLGREPAPVRGERQRPVRARRHVVAEIELGERERRKRLERQPDLVDDVGL
jgi:hypothetical protein